MRVRRLTAALRPSPRDDSGAVAIIVAILMTTFLILGAFAVDVANAYAQGRQVSVAMDSAALSAAAKVGDAMPLNTACDQNVLNGLKNTSGVTVGAQAIAQAEADAINAKNRKDGLPEAVQSVTVACADNGKAVDVKVANTRGVPTALAGVIGISSINPGNFATARWGKQKVAGGLRPWAVCASTMQAAQSDPGTTYWTALGNWNNAAAGICGTSAPGQWGGVDFDGGSNSTVDLADWTANGYPGAVDINADPLLPADPGVSNSSALRDAFISLINSVVLFPVVTGIQGGGNNSTFDAVGIGTVKVCGVVYNGTIYNTGSTCWTNPRPPQTTYSTPVTVGPYSSTGSMTKGSDVLTLPADAFNGVTFGPNIENVATITVPGAAKVQGQPGPLTATVTLPAALPIGTLPLGASAAYNVPAGTPITITVQSRTSTTDPGFGLYDKNDQLQDMIEFRWVDYQGGSYAGPGSDNPCALTDPLCVGRTVLWQ